MFWTSFILPDFLNYLLAGGAFSIVFIPIFSSYIAKEQSEDGWRSFSRIANAIIALSSYFYHFCGCCFLIWHLCSVMVFRRTTCYSCSSTKEYPSCSIFHLVGGFCLPLYRHKIICDPCDDRFDLYHFDYIGGLIFSSAEGFAYGVLFGSIVGRFCTASLWLSEIGDALVSFLFCFRCRREEIFYDLCPLCWDFQYCFR